MPENTETLQLAALGGAAVLLVVAAVVGATVAAAAAGRLGPERGLGLRTPALLAGPRQWRTGHRAALVPVEVGVAGLAASALALAALRDPAIMIGVALAGVVWLVVWLLVGLIRAEQAAREG